MALDLSMQSHPLDLSTKKDRNSKSVDQCRQMSSTFAASRAGSVRSALKRVSFAGNCTKVTNHPRNKLTSTWCLKKRLLEYHREALEREEKENRSLKARCHDVGQEDLVTTRSADEDLQADCAPHQSHTQYQADHTSSPHHFPAFPLPTDPRDWSRLDVCTWLQHMKMTYDLRDVHPERFPMNGKGLCLMSPDMFTYRVPDAGRLLYRDFRLRLARALSLCTPQVQHK